jgi:hypothetical protein
MPHFKLNGNSFFKIFFDWKMRKQGVGRHGEGEGRDARGGNWPIKTARDLEKKH